MNTSSVWMAGWLACTAPFHRPPRMQLCAGMWTVCPRPRGFRVHRFDRVDIVMARAGVVRVARDDSPELAYDFSGAGVRSTVGSPVIPWAEGHQRFGVQGRGVE